MCPESSGWGLPGTSTWSWDSQPLPIHWEPVKLLGHAVFARVCTTTASSTPSPPPLMLNRPPEAGFPWDSRPWAAPASPTASGGACGGEEGVRRAAGMCAGMRERSQGWGSSGNPAGDPNSASSRTKGSGESGNRSPQYNFLPQFPAPKLSFSPYVGGKSTSSPSPSNPSQTGNSSVHVSQKDFPKLGAEGRKAAPFLLGVCMFHLHFANSSLLSFNNKP